MAEKYTKVSGAFCFFTSPFLAFFCKVTATARQLAAAPLDLTTTFQAESGRDKERKLTSPCKVLPFFFFWLRWVFVAVRGLSLVAASGGYCSLRSVGFSLRWLLLLQSTGSRCMGFSSCSTWAQ